MRSLLFVLTLALTLTWAWATAAAPEDEPERRFANERYCYQMPTVLSVMDAHLNEMAAHADAGLDDPKNLELLQNRAQVTASDTLDFGMRLAPHSEYAQQIQRSFIDYTNRLQEFSGHFHDEPPDTGNIRRQLGNLVDDFLELHVEVADFCSPYQ